MTPAQAAARIRKGEIAPAYLFLGQEAYQRRRLKDLLIAAVLDEGGAEEGLARYDLTEHAIVQAVDDARSLSLFASHRLIWVSNAEAALPKGKAAEAEEEADGPASGSAAELVEYLKNPTPGVVLVFEAARYDFEGEDKKKLERVRKFYSSIAAAVEFVRFRPEDARAEAQSLAREAGFSIDADALDLLVEALGADVQRIAVEIEKLALFAAGRRVTADDVAVLAPDARSTTVFALVNALGRKNRAQALSALDTLTRDGEYLPLALAFLSTQLRLALAAREAGLKTPQQVSAHFTKLGMTMWPSRAEQVCHTMTRFAPAQLARAIESMYKADKGLRDARPDDRIVMEQFVLELTA